MFDSPIKHHSAVKIISKLIREKEAIKNMIERLILPVIVTSKKTRKIVYANSYAQKQYEISSEELIGMEISEFYTQSNQREKILSSFEGGCVENLELEFMTKKGKVFVGLLSLIDIVFYEEDCWLGIVVDVTVQKKQQQELVHIHKELERYIEAIGKVTIISRTNEKGIITYVNDIFCDISKYPRDELIGQNQSIIRHPDTPPLVFKRMWRDIKKGKPWNGKIKNKDRNGESYYVNCTVFPLYDEEDKNIVEYIGIRFLITEDEIQKREFKKRVIQNIQDSKMKELDYKGRVTSLEEEIISLKNHINFIQNSYDSEKRTTKKLRSQIKNCENQIVKIEESKSLFVDKAKSNLKQVSNKNYELEQKNKRIYKNNIELEEEYSTAQREIQKLQAINEQSSKTIANLRDVISFLETKIEQYENKK